MMTTARCALLTTALVIVVTVTASAQSALDRVKNSGELRIGTDATYPPFGSAEGGGTRRSPFTCTSGKRAGYFWK